MCVCVFGCMLGSKRRASAGSLKQSCCDFKKLQNECKLHVFMSVFLLLSNDHIFNLWWSLFVYEAMVESISLTKVFKFLRL
jgi:hypothetical protein